MPDKKPHILLLITDEQRADVLPIEGNGVIRTPTFDRIFASGTYFRNAYCTSPICVPGRQSLLSGLYPHHCGSVRFGDPMPSEVLTFMEHLARYGYYGCSAGKMHFVGQDQMHGWTERIGFDTKTHCPNPNLVDDSERAARRVVEPGTGKWSQAKEVANARVGRGRTHMDAYSVDGMLHFLDDYFVNEPYDRPGTLPLLACVSLYSPHYPYQCSRELFEYYMTRVEPFVEELQEKLDAHKGFKVRAGKDVTVRELHRATAAYYGLIEFCDRQFGRVIAKLEDLNVLQDFAVVTLTDHGDMLGQKGLWEKQTYFDGAARVPFSVAWPQRIEGGRVVTENVSLVDLFPTLCDIADVPIPDGLDGRSLVPLMEGRAEDWPNTVYAELHQPNPGPSFMVKQGHMKYFCFKEQDWPDQLFDMAKDPEERHNLIDDPTYADILAELRAKVDALPPPRKKDANNRFID